MASPVSFFEAISALKTAYDVYQQIKDAPGKIDEIGKRMSTLRSYLTSLQVLIDDKAPLGLAKKRAELVHELREMASGVQEDSKQIAELLDKFKNQKVFFGMELQFKWVATAIFTAKDMGKLEGLSDGIDRRINLIGIYINLLNGFGLNSLLTQKPISLPDHTAAYDGLKSGMGPSTLPNSGTAPSFRRRDYRIIFVDPNNEARSVVSAAYAQLIRKWTIVKDGQWSVMTIHSAGLAIQNQSDTIDILRSVLPLYPGVVKPNKIAIDALFDNDSDYPSKDKILEKTMQQTSRGLTSRLFKDYDYILTFERKHAQQLGVIRKVFREHLGQSAFSEGKGSVVLLGAYSGGKDPEIKDGIWKLPISTEEKRQKWNVVASKIKVSIRGWLKAEMGWQKPSH